MRNMSLIMCCLLSLVACQRDDYRINSTTNEFTGAIYSKREHEVLNEVFSINFEKWISCANSGNGELVQFSGKIQYKANLVQKLHDRPLLIWNTIPTEVKGRGTNTGIEYVATPCTEQQFYIHRGESTMYQDKIQLTGLNTDEQIIIQSAFEIWVYDNDAFSASKSLPSFDCK